MYSVIMGHLGSDMVAANAVAVVAKNLGTVICFGIANAGAILLGKAIGAGQMDTVKEDASRFCWITFASGIAGGALIFLLRPVFMNMADLSAAAQGYLGIMLFINMYSVLGQAMNSTVICGVFRAGGDSRWGFICDVIDKWLREHLGFRGGGGGGGTKPAPPEPDYRPPAPCPAAPPAPPPDILAAYRLQRDRDFEDPYSGGSSVSAALSTPTVPGPIKHPGGHPTSQHDR